MVARRACILALASVVSAGAAAFGAESTAPVVARVELRSDVELVRPDAVPPLITIQPGRPLDPRESRHTLRNLVASGQVAEAEIWTRSSVGGDGEVDVVVAVWSAVFVDRVEVEGDVGLSREEWQRELAIRVGQPLRESRILRTVYRLRDRHAESGWLDARVRVAVDVDDASRRAEIVFRVEKGERYRFAEPEVTGVAVPIAERLVSRAKIRSGRRYRQAKAQEGEERILAELHELGYRSASVTRSERIDRELGTVAVRFEIVRGPRIEIEARGVDLDRLEKKEVLPFLGRQGYDEILLSRAADDVTEFLQGQGFHEAQVRVETETGPEAVQIDIEAVPGDRRWVRDVRFEGNETISGERLQRLVATRPRGRVTRGGALVDTVLERDLDNLRFFYALEGYDRVVVGPPEVVAGADGLEVIVPIVEGRRRRVVDLRVEGPPPERTAALGESLSLWPGGPFHPRRLEESLATMRSRLERDGFPDAVVTSTLDWSADGSLVDVDITVFEGPRHVAERLVVRGLTRTQSSLVRTVVDLQPGEPVSSERLFEIQRALYRLGIFSRVVATSEPAGDGPSRRNVVVEVEEGRTRRVRYGFNYDSEVGLGGLLGFSRANLFGKAVRFQVDARGNQKQGRFRLALHQPLPRPGAETAVTYLLYAEREERPTYVSDERGGQVRFTRTLNAFRYSFAVDGRDVELGRGPDTEGLLPEVPDDELRELTAVEIVSLIGQATFDLRDDPINSTRGRLSSAFAQWAVPFRDYASEDFVKGIVQHTEYVPIGVGTVVGGLRLGAIESLGSSSDSAVNPVNLSERFFAGGRNSHRAFPRDKLGLVGETLIEEVDPETGTTNLIATGGNGLLLLNVDLRFPLIGDLGGTVFVDGGSVWRDWRDFDPNDLRWGAGLGLRYDLPIGPLRIEVGWKLDRAAAESPFEAFLSFGNAF